MIDRSRTQRRVIGIQAPVSGARVDLPYLGEDGDGFEIDVLEDRDDPLRKYCQTVACQRHINNLSRYECPLGAMTVYPLCKLVCAKIAMRS